jgi:chromosomal replication initiator protein
MSRTDNLRRPRPETIASLNAVLTRIADGTLALPRPIRKAGARPALRATGAASEHDRTALIILQRLVAEAFGLHRYDLIARCRTKEVAFPRHVAMYLARELTCASLPQIGRAFNRDHATVLHACRHVKESLLQDTALADALAPLAERFREARAAEQARRIESITFEPAALSR